jgi:vacuolar-type H+-ATPase subunit H
MSDEHPNAADALERDLGPGDLSTRGLPTARRGYEKKAVDALVADAVDRWAELQRQHDELLEQVATVGGADHLARDLGAMGAEVGRILEAAQDAATSLRDRAREDAERVRSLASADADATMAAAEQQAFDARRSAWEQATSLVESAVATAEQILIDAREDLLRMRAEGEREAHRRAASTRKETDDLVRAARFEAERELTQARALAREIVERAEDIAGGDASGGTRSRQEALTEIERLHAERAIKGVAVLPAEPAPDPESVGVTQPTGRADLSDDLAAEVQLLRDASQSGSPGPSPADLSATDPGEIGTLFEALRTTVEPDGDDTTPASGPELIALRDRLLLGLHNSALRDVKRRIADLQEQALEGLRGAGWTPASEVFGSDLSAVFDPLIARSASLGAERARADLGVRGVASPGQRAPTLVSSMAADLVSQLRSALSGATGGPEETASTVRRVFRAWRSDEAERWTGMILAAAYHDALLASCVSGGFDRVRGVDSGAGCRGCLGASEAEWDPAKPPEENGVPPVDPSCRCTFEVVKK